MKVKESRIVPQGSVSKRLACSPHVSPPSTLEKVSVSQREKNGLTCPFGLRPGAPSLAKAPCVQALHNSRQTTYLENPKT